MGPGGQNGGWVSAAQDAHDAAEALAWQAWMQAEEQAFFREQVEAGWRYLGPHRLVELTAHAAILYGHPFVSLLLESFSLEPCGIPPDDTHHFSIPFLLDPPPPSL